MDAASSVSFAGAVAAELTTFLVDEYGGSHNITQESESSPGSRDPPQKTPTLRTAEVDAIRSIGGKISVSLLLSGVPPAAARSILQGKGLATLSAGDSTVVVYEVIVIGGRDANRDVYSASKFPVMSEGLPPLTLHGLSTDR